MPNDSQQYLQLSKTDERAKGQVLYIFPTTSVPSNPVRALALYMSMHPRIGPLSPPPICIHFDGKGIARFQVNHVLRMALHVSGIVQCRGKGWSHSLRIGAASWFILQNYSIEQIKGIGRWAPFSDVVKTIRIN